MICKHTKMIEINSIFIRAVQSEGDSTRFVLLNSQSRGHEFKANCRLFKIVAILYNQLCMYRVQVFWMRHFYKVVDPFILICISEHGHSVGRLLRWLDE